MPTLANGAAARFGGGLAITALTLLVTATACSGVSSPSRSTETTQAANVAGTWAGSSTSNLTSGSIRLTITIAQTGTTLSGSWASSWPDPMSDNAGTLSGTVTGSTVLVTLNSGNPRLCSASATGVLSGNTMSGSYAAIFCSVANGGLFTITR